MQLFIAWKYFMPLKLEFYRAIIKSVTDFGFSKQAGLKNQVFNSVNKSLYRIKVAEQALADLHALRTKLS